MGGLKKYMPITWITSLIGSLALIGAPGFAGFYSKDSIIEAVHTSAIAGSGFAYICVLLGVFVTALYSFRMYFLVFHGKERMDEHTRSHLHESPKVVTVPLILLAIPSVLAGAVMVGDMAFGNYFGEAIFVLPQHDVLAELAKDFDGWLAMIVHGMTTLPFWLAAAGVFTAWWLYMVKPGWPAWIKDQFGWLYTLLDKKYYADIFNDWFFAGGSRGIGRGLWQFGDVKIIDGLMVNGTARTIGWFSAMIRHVQSGYLYHYAFAMIFGLLLLFGLFVLG